MLWASVKLRIRGEVVPEVLRLLEREVAGLSHRGVALAGPRLLVGSPLPRCGLSGKPLGRYPTPRSLHSSNPGAYDNTWVIDTSKSYKLNNTFCNARVMDSLATPRGTFSRPKPPTHFFLTAHLPTTPRSLGSTHLLTQPNEKTPKVAQCSNQFPDKLWLD